MSSIFHRLFHTTAYLEAEKLAEERNCELMRRLEQLNESTINLRNRLDEVETVTVIKEPHGRRTV